MATKMNMSNYEFETDSYETAYDDEILSAGWNPDVDLACQYLPHAVSDSHSDMPADLTTEMPELFLNKMYSYQE